ncbi:MAG: diaminopimelate decarboxylase [Candidatus Ratteibacteria bacterium]|nr:diaminopimelate decarboxylase [Candidatus Ratteibacteria bacterium]
MEKNIEVIFNNFFRYKNNRFYAEGISVEDIADRYGTPCYVYSYNSLLSQIKKFKEAFQGFNNLICYSVKANSNLTILTIINQQGIGVDIVSEGEMRKAFLAQFPADKIVFAGVGKKDEEIEMGIKKRIYCFNVENEEEIDVLKKYANKYKKKVLCNLRLNLDMDVDTHHYIKTSKKETKFGIDMHTAAKILKKNRNNRYIEIKGFHLHLGSQLKDVVPYIKALDIVKKFCNDIAFTPEIIDIGGGFGIPYSSMDNVKDIKEFGPAINNKIKEIGTKLLILEPGRYLVGNTAVLLCRVLYVKKRYNKNFVITDAGMNDFIRPALYGSYHSVLPAKKSSGRCIKADIVGPICETGDYLAKDVEVPAGIKKGDIIIIGSAGAYCFSMSSNYNSRPRPCEIMVDNNRTVTIRKREEYRDLWKSEV